MLPPSRPNRQAAQARFLRSVTALRVIHRHRGGRQIVAGSMLTAWSGPDIDHRRTDADGTPTKTRRKAAGPVVVRPSDSSMTRNESLQRRV